MSSKVILTEDVKKAIYNNPIFFLFLFLVVLAFIVAYDYFRLIGIKKIIT